jgi:hypothetical protein
MNEFIEQVEGNNYKFHIQSVIPFSNSSFSHKRLTDENQYDMGFFCSQLVIKCYKHLGVLSTNKGSHRFFPSDLSSTSKK